MASVLEDLQNKRFVPDGDTDEVATDEVETDEVETDEVDTDKVATDEVETDEVETDEVDTDEVETDEVETDEETSTSFDDVEWQGAQPQTDRFDDMSMSLQSMNLTVLLSMIKELPPEDRLELLASLKMASEDELSWLIGHALDKPLSDTQLMFMQYTEYRVHKLMLLYIPPILLLLGTFGNIFSFLILRDKAMMRQSTHQFLAALAIVDSLVLYIGLFRQWLGELTGFDPRDQASWLCKLIVMLGYTSSDVSVWLIVAVTVERYIVVNYPLQANQMCVVTRAKRIVVGVVMVFVVINCHFFWTADIKWHKNADGEPSNPHCDSTEGHEFLVSDVWPWVDALLYGFGPFLIICIFNVFIIVKVVKANSGRIILQNRCAMVAAKTGASSPQQQQFHSQQSLTADVKNEFSNNNHSGSKPTSSSHSNRNCTSFRLPGNSVRRSPSDSNTRLTIMLLSVSFTFLLTTLPMNISVIAATFWNREADDLRRMSRFQLVTTVSQLLMYLNHSVNFFLYCATGRKFRSEVIRKVCGKQRPNTVVSDHSQHIFCSRMCVIGNGYIEIRKSADETEV